MTFKAGVRICAILLLASLSEGKGTPLVREANTTLALPDVRGVSGYGVTNALGDLVFEQPVGIISPPGETNRLFILERAGRVYVVTNLAAPTKTLFLDLTARVESGFIERGLLGMDFHPNYGRNGYFYIFRTLVTSTEGAGGTVHGQLSRFETSSLDPSVAVPESEVVLFAQYDGSEEHNAGDVHFGPDGYLYVSLGEDLFLYGAAVTNRQALDRKFHGAIIRIDVDKRPGSLPPNPHPAVTTNYAVPPDNPFIGLTNYQGFSIEPNQLRTEFYAIGFRNPWRFCFDSLTGGLYCADVGAGSYEEISFVLPGGNYGWPYREGMQEGWSPPAGFLGRDPIVEYAHGKATNQGDSVTGGVVYRGAAIPQLYGWYVFGDYVRGHIWATHYDGTPGLKPFQRLTGDWTISTFGVDPRDGELLFANLSEGRIKKLIYVPPEQAAPFPQTLADTGAFADLTNLTPHTGLVPYDVSVNFWSDHAHKRRWFSIPNGPAQFGFQPEGNWGFPKGTVWVKHFDLEITNGVAASRRKLETRFLVKGSDETYGVTYIWDVAQTNAVLASQEGGDELIAIYNPDGSLLRTQAWRYPSELECRVCHNSSAGYALGFSTAQLNLDHDYDGTTTNQLLAFSAAGYLDTSLASVAAFRTLRPATDEARPLYDRVRSYLSANCSSCHHPGGPTTIAKWDARLQVPLDLTHILEKISPRNPNESAIHSRISSQYTDRMPPMASSEVDQSNVDLMRDWILSFPSTPWAYGDIGHSEREGSSAISAEEFQIAGTGSFTGLTNDALHFLSQPLTGNGHLVARLIAQQPTGPHARAGLMLREDEAADAPTVFLCLLASGEIQFEGRLASGADLVKTDIFLDPAPRWLRLLREEDQFGGYVSSDGSNWLAVGEVTASLTKTLRAGFGVVSDTDLDVNLARFTNFSLVGVTITASNQLGEAIAPARITLEADVNHTGNQIAQVVFLEGTNALGEVTAPPYLMFWSNAPAGPHTIIARVVDETGLVVVSQAIEVEVDFPSALANFQGAESGAGGDWQGRFGSEGYALAGDSTNLPAHVTLGIEAASPFIWTSTSELRALMQADGSGRVAACWYSDETMIFDLPLTDGGLKSLTLYCLDWDIGGGRSQRVDLVDGQSGAILSSEVLTNFMKGVYLTWVVRGHVQVHVTALAGNAVVSGVFLAAAHNDPPTVQITSPTAASTLTAPTNVALLAQAADVDGRVERLEFFANGLKIGEATNSPFAVIWESPLAGEYTLTARAWDDLGDGQLSAPVNVRVALPEVWVKFLREDTTIQGSWRGAFGAEGYSIADHAISMPAFAAVESPAVTYTWINDVSSPRALQHVADPLCIAACYFDNAALSFDVRLTDGKAHQLALYFVDWDSSARQIRVDLTDIDSGVLLDMRQVQDFNPGKYLQWAVRNGVRFTLTALQGNVVVSGIFLDAAPAIEVWRSTAFSAVQLQDPLTSGNLGDPDADGRANLFEYAVGSDPLLSDADPVFSASFGPSSGVATNDFIIAYIRSKSASDVVFNVQGTSDWVTWKDVGSRFVPVDIVENADRKTETVRLRFSEPVTEQLYLRLKMNLAVNVRNP